MTSSDFYTMHTLLLCASEVPDVFMELIYMAFEYQKLLNAANSSLIFFSETHRVKRVTQIYTYF